MGVITVLLEKVRSCTWAARGESGRRTPQNSATALSNPWELAAIPFLPVLDLVAEHCENLTVADVDGIMLSWTVGGYPSPNLQVAHRFATMSGANKETVLDAIATERYGAAATACCLYTSRKQEFLAKGLYSP